jgi:hypothetical protein
MISWFKVVNRFLFIVYVEGGYVMSLLDLFKMLRCIDASCNLSCLLLAELEQRRQEREARKKGEEVVVAKPKKKTEEFEGW